jgi:hypothetical protein
LLLVGLKPIRGGSSKCLTNLVETKQRSEILQRISNT